MGFINCKEFIKITVEFPDAKRKHWFNQYAKAGIFDSDTDMLLANLVSTKERIYIYDNCYEVVTDPETIKSLEILYGKAS